MNKKTLAMLLGGIFALQAGLSHAAESRAVSYLTMWSSYGATELSEKLPASKADTFLLSFGEWSADGSINFSENALTPPAWDAYYLPTPYVSWTTFKYDHPDKKIMVAFGGQTYEGIWSHLNTPEQREKVAQSLAALLAKPFPVYKKNLQLSQIVGECPMMAWETACDTTHYHYAGNVYLDGIDFDFEKGSRLTEQENQNLLALVARLRELVGNEKLLSLTTYHVGADPENCADSTVTENCSYIEPSRSAHHGEVTQLLKDSKDLFDFFNVMTYDAGKNFRYQVAMENYARAVGDKSKILVGATINHQWQPDGTFVETEENNLERVAWQAENGYGGFFVWALGQSTLNLPLTSQAEYIGRLADAANAASIDITKPADSAEAVKPEEKVEEERPAMELTIPDVSKMPALAYINYQNGGEIRLYATDNDLKKHYTVKLNDKYVYSINSGKFYYSYKTEHGNSINTLIHQLTADEFQMGDVLTLQEGSDGKVLQTITISDNVRYSDDEAVQAISTQNGRIAVTLNEKYYNKANRYMVFINGEYLMESYNGKAYYSYIDKSKGLVTFYNKTAVKAGDKIEVIRASGKPGVKGYSTSVIKSLKVDVLG